MEDNNLLLENLTVENEKLKKTNKLLSEQVHKLIKTESSLYRFQEQLDAQMRIYKSLHKLGNKFSSLKKKEDLYKVIGEFIENDINVQRSLFFVEENGTLICKYKFGYYEENDIEFLGLELPNFVSDYLHNNNEYFESYHCKNNDAKIFLETIDLCEFLAIPLSKNENKKITSVFLCGNSESKRKFYSRIVKGDLYHIGMANMANQAGIAIQNIENFSALLEERQQLENKVNERTVDLTHALSEIKKLDKLKTQMFANISHELRTPLTLSLAPLDLIREKYLSQLSQPVVEHIDVIHKNLIKLYSLINEFLEFSKLEANESQLNISPINVEKAIQICLSTMRSALMKKKISLDFKKECAQSNLFLDIRKFERIIINLLSNSFKFTPVGGHIDIIIKDKNDYEFQIIVADNGTGIPKELHSKVFERFSQVDGSETREFAGTGIGLAMVKEYTELHHGEIKIEGDLNQGTKMILTFKKGKDHYKNLKINELLQEIDQNLIENSIIKDFSYENGLLEDDQIIENSSIQYDESHQIRTNSKPNEVHGTILVVEDNIELRKFLKVFLSEQHRVFTARDGLDAWNKIQKIIPDIIISDVMMPNMSGNELCAKVKNDFRFSRIPFILLTAKMDYDLKLMGLKMGVDDYINKPFNPTELLARVNNMIKLRQYQKNLITLNNDLDSANKKIKDQQSSLIKSEKMNVLGEIVAGVSHELSSPLLALSSGLSWFNRYIDDLEQQLKIYNQNLDLIDTQAPRRNKKSKIMNSSIEKMRHHINKLKSYIRFQASEQSEYDLNNEIETSLHILDYLKPSHVTIVSELQEGIPRIKGNAAEVNQLLSNLIKNAIEAIPEDRKGLIKIESKYNIAGFVQLKIKDNGKGIDKNIQDGLFKEIRTSKEKGTGVGLYLCNTIIKNNKIDVDIDSTQNVGTTFILTFKEFIKACNNGLNNVEEKKFVSN